LIKFGNLIVVIKKSYERKLETKCVTVSLNASDLP